MSSTEIQYQNPTLVQIRATIRPNHAPEVSRMEYGVTSTLLSHTCFPREVFLARSAWISPQGRLRTWWRGYMSRPGVGNLGPRALQSCWFSSCYWLVDQVCGVSEKTGTHLVQIISSEKSKDSLKTRRTAAHDLHPCSRASSSQRWLKWSMKGRFGVFYWMFCSGDKTSD